VGEGVRLVLVPLPPADVRGWIYMGQRREGYEAPFGSWFPFPGDPLSFSIRGLRFWKTVEHGLAVNERTGHFAGMPKLDRITFDSSVMGGKPCIRGLRVTVGTLVGLFAAGKTREDILRLYPYLEAADLDAALTYAAWRSEEQDVAVSVA